MDYRKPLIAVAAGLAALGLWFHLHKRDVKIESTTLSPNVAEKLIINPGNHSLIVINDKGTNVTRLPDRPSSIEFMKDGAVKITAPQSGFEAVPFIGIGYSQSLNDYIGLDYFYWKRLDFGVAFSFDRDVSFKHTALIALVSYNVWRNSQLSVGVDTAGHVHGLVSVRL